MGGRWESREWVTGWRSARSENVCHRGRVGGTNQAWGTEGETRHMLGVKKKKKCTEIRVRKLKISSLYELNRLWFILMHFDDVVINRKAGIIEIVSSFCVTIWVFTASINTAHIKENHLFFLWICILCFYKLFKKGGLLWRHKSQNLHIATPHLN